ncbi:MAG: hypothetical protein CVV44_20445 [Spirochaetae bacterium HGW-Spirochaetae-1]|jgi:two-component system NtrC family sensor kinase|nr:MAG: hypothetical protein CVV44_20445 [Spirochaetae bacterium HGW-Spirochaetae-1]
MPIRMVSRIRSKIFASFIMIIIMIGGGAVIIGIKMINDNIVAQAYEQVQKHLETTQYMYDQEGKTQSLFLLYVSHKGQIADAAEARNRSILIAKLKEVNLSLESDILAITDARGRVLARLNNSDNYGDYVGDIACINHVLKEGKPCTGSEILTRDILLAEGEDVARRTFIKVIPTPHERKLKKESEDRALVQMAAFPIFKNNTLVGIIYSAKILNNSMSFVDRIRSLVFKDEKIKGQDLGTTTIFLDDVRISTNVKRLDGSSSIGTRVSEQVYHQVVEKRSTWLDKAFVVNTWYIAAYTPIFDINEKVIGILYVGILEDKFNAIKRQTIAYLVALIFLTSILAFFLNIYLLRNILNPIKSLMIGANEVAKGNFSYKIGRRYEGEMELLCTAFDKMVDAIEEKDRALKERTQQQIMQSEKLASLGRLASGIAHEINNPLTGVLTYSSLLLDDLKETEYSEDLKVIVDETMRCRSIVRGILDFARETKLEKQRTNLNKIIIDSLSILEKNYRFQNVTIHKVLGDIPDFNIDVNQMISVINNFAINSADAMPGGGSLVVQTWYEHGNHEVVMSITDTGTGISRENLKKIFDPFFTTKETGQGTGLGLAVTYGIVERHGGTIAVESTVGEGTTFTIRLPVM